MKDVALVGLPYSGKSTIWGAVARAHSAPTGSGKANVAVVAVPDPRLDRMTEVVSAVKSTPAQIRLVDVPGMTAQGLGEAREADALAIVLRAFGDDADPARDLASFRAELAVADLSTVEKGIERVRKRAKTGDADAKVELEAYERAETVLGEDRWLIEERWDPAHEYALRLMTPLTLKPVLHVVNTDEDPGAAPDLPGRTVAVSGLLEAEAGELSPEEAASLLAEFGVTESATSRFIGAVYDTLDLVSFFTGNEKEARAWEIPRGTKAPQAAGTIHRDFEQGFIRWEAVAFDDFVELGSWDAAREVGKLRAEGKDYEVRDGDVVRVRHS